jgi:hypothetical protein
MRHLVRGSGPPLVRRQLAIFVLAIWGLGVELAPGLHVALHDLLEAHHHEGDEAGHHDDPADDPDHGSNSLAHKHVALLAAPPPPRIPPLAVVGEEPPLEPRAGPPRSRRPAWVRQRGPPQMTWLALHT